MSDTVTSTIDCSDFSGFAIVFGDGTLQRKRLVCLDCTPGGVWAKSIGCTCESETRITLNCLVHVVEVESGEAK